MQIKRHYLLIPSAVLPYIALLTILTFITVREITLAIFGLVFLLLLLISLPANIIYCVRCISEKASVSEAIKANMILKLIHIPAYIAIFFIEAIALITIFTFWFVIPLSLFDMYLIIQTGIVGAVASKRSCDEGKMSTTAAVLFGISQFVYCVDVITAIVIHVKQKRKI